MIIVDYQVGVAHARSICFSYLLGTKHVNGNGRVFNYIVVFYPYGFKLFRQRKRIHAIQLTEGICADLDDEQFDIMIDVALELEPLWQNAIGKNWKSTITREKLKSLYQKM